MCTLHKQLCLRSRQRGMLHPASDCTTLMLPRSSRQGPAEEHAACCMPALLRTPLPLTNGLQPPAHRVPAPWPRGGVRPVRGLLVQGIQQELVLLRERLGACNKEE